MACKNQYNSIVKILIDNKVDVEIRDNKGYMGYDYLNEKSKQDIKDYILEKDY